MRKIGKKKKSMKENREKSKSKKRFREKSQVLKQIYRSTST